MSRRKKEGTPEYKAEWARAKKLCRLNAEEVRMAKEPNFLPRTLISNIPSPQQRWKAPVKIWVRDLWEERQFKLTGRWPDLPRTKEYEPPPGAEYDMNGDLMPERDSDWHESVRQFRDDDAPF